MFFSVARVLSSEFRSITLVLELDDISGCCMAGSEVSRLEDWGWTFVLVIAAISRFSDDEELLPPLLLTGEASVLSVSYLHSEWNLWDQGSFIWILQKRGD